MKITIYELLGKMKDYEAPNKILFNDKIWTYNGNDYEAEDEWSLFDEYVIFDILNDEVEILETTITYKQDTINKVDEPYESCIFGTDYEFATELEKKIIDNIELIRKKQDEIIYKFNEIIEKVNNL